MIWGTQAADMDSAQQCTAIINQLTGAAAELAQNFSYDEMTAGGIVNGVQVDAVAYLLTQLAAQFAPHRFSRPDEVVDEEVMAPRAKTQGQRRHSDSSAPSRALWVGGGISLWVGIFKIT